MTELRNLKYPGAKHMGRAYHDSGSFASAYPNGILMHYTADGHAAQLLHGKNERKVSCHFTIDRDGTVYQCAALDQCCHHAGASAWKGLVGLNRYWIGIEQANYGYWRPGIKPATRVGAVRAGWLLAKHKNGGPGLLWEPYAAKLISVAEDLVRWLLKEIPTIKHLAGHDDVSPGRKSDPGPAFPMEQFDKLVHSDSESNLGKLVVQSPDFLNVRGGPGTNYGIIGRLENTEEVVLIRDEGSWSLVGFDGDKKGYVFDKYLVPA